MQVSKYKISGRLQDELIAFFTESILFDYINISDETTLLATEAFYLRTNSDQLNLIVLKKVDADLYIDLIAGGGGTGLFSITWGSEGSFVKKTFKLLQDFCKNQGESIEPRE